jgi:hypothetical protein
MSYCRQGEDSDVYVIRSGDQLVCYCNVGSFHCFSEQDMITHLRDHEAEGLKVPQRAYDRLEAERQGNPYETDVQRALREEFGIQ